MTLGDLQSILEIGIALNFAQTARPIREIGRRSSSRNKVTGKLRKDLALLRSEDKANSTIGDGYLDDLDERKESAESKNYGTGKFFERIFVVCSIILALVLIVAIVLSSRYAGADAQNICEKEVYLFVCSRLGGGIVQSIYYLSIVSVLFPLLVALVNWRIWKGLNKKLEKELDAIDQTAKDQTNEKLMDKLKAYSGNGSA